MKKSSRPSEASSGLSGRRGRTIPVAMLLILVVLLSAGSGMYAGASFFAQQAPGVTVTTTLFTTTTSWTTSTIWSTVTSVVQGILTTIQYTTSTSTVTVTGSTSYRTGKTVTANGNAQIDTAQSKFGGASGLFDGAGDYLSTPDSADWAFGTDDFTIDFWVRFNAFPGTGESATVYSQFVDFSNRWYLDLMNSPAGTYSWRFRLISGGSDLINIAKITTIATNTWYHMAFVRRGSNWYIFQNGTQVGTTATDTDSIPDLAASLFIGTFEGSTSFLNGWLDEFRISRVARWTSNFTPPTAPYASDPYTALLLHMDGADTSTTFLDDVTTFS